MTDRLPELTARLRELDDIPVADHPDVLEDLHRSLVAELDALAGSAGSTASRR